MKWWPRSRPGRVQLALQGSFTIAAILGSASHAPLQLVSALIVCASLVIIAPVVLGKRWD
jgi:hypothetical protein